jgi:hypothetical protein
LKYGNLATTWTLGTSSFNDCDLKKGSNQHAEFLAAIKKGDSPGKWEEMRGHRGVISHVYDGNLHVVVREDIAAAKLRFRVLVYSREVSRHGSMEEARLEVLRRLVEVAGLETFGMDNLQLRSAS